MTSPPLRVPSAIQVDLSDAALDELDAAVAEQDVGSAGMGAGCPHGPGTIQPGFVCAAALRSRRPWSFGV